MIEDMTPEDAHNLIIECIPSVVASLAARIADPSGETLAQVVNEQVELANAAGLSGVEFGLIKLQACERVGVWLLNVLVELTGFSHEELLMEMTDTLSEVGVNGFFGSSEA